MDIAVVGTGYVGLVSGTCFADSGNNVTCVDIDEEKVKRLKSGEVPIYEPGLRTILTRSIREDRLHFTTDLKEAVDVSDLIFLCLPTPAGADGEADLSAVLKVGEQLGKMIDRYKIIVNKSTVPVGTAEKVSERIARNATVDFDVVSNPEFLREGTAVEDFKKPERVVIGTGSERAAETLTTLYEPFVRSGNPIIVMDERSAEITKYAANSMLATKITFMNEIANICERMGANVDNVRRGIGTDSRIGNRYLFPGIGYGGSCFPKDVKAIHHSSERNGYDFKILDAVMKVNDAQKVSIVDKMEKFFETDDFSRKTFGIWGLSFKPETDDVREAPSLYITQKLVSMGASLKAYDPEAVETFRETIDEKTRSSITMANNPKAAIEDVDALVICTEWNEFRRPTLENFEKYMNEPVIFDGRNLYDLNRVREAGITYISIGRPAVNVPKVQKTG